MKRISIFLLILLSISFINATIVINPTSLLVNKTYNVPLYTNINITNAGAYVYTNITLETNDITSFNKIDTLNPGETKIINLTINGNYNTQKSLRVKGYYFSNAGQPFNTYHVNVSSYSAQLNPCDITMIKGDTLKIKNLLNNNIIIKDTTTNIDVANLANNVEYTIPFNAPTIFRYSIYVTGFQLTNICTISVMDTNAFINDPLLDGRLNITTNINYEPTTLNYTMMNTNFSMNFFDTRDGMMTVSNTGSKIAYNVTLKADWLSFNSNGFNLNPGETKGLIFTVTPIIYSTTDTNKTHVKTISITGNFPTQNTSISTYINYANFEGNTSNADIDYLNRVFCPQYPNSVLCNGSGTQIVYRYVNNMSDEQVNISMSSSQIRDLWIHQLQKDDELTTTNNILKEQLASIQANQSMIAYNSQTLSEKQSALEQSQANNARGILFFMIGFILVFSLLMIGVLIYFYKKRGIITKVNTWDGSIVNGTTTQ